MTFVSLLRRWGILALGGAFLLLGLVIFLSHSTITFGWTSYAPLSDLVFLPGSPQSYSGHHFHHRHGHFNGQISMAVGVALIAAWMGFFFGRRTEGS